MADELSVFAKHISLEDIAEGPKNIANGLEKERRAPVEIKPRQPVAYRPSHKFVADVLVNGPVPATTILQRGTERGFTRRQIQYAKEQMKVVAFKDQTWQGCWFWLLPHHEKPTEFLKGSKKIPQ
jgi:hypothetical protein